MSYDTDLDIGEAESSFEDPTEALEAEAEADDPEGDLGDGQRRRRLGKEDLDNLGRKRVLTRRD